MHGTITQASAAIATATATAHLIEAVGAPLSEEDLHVRVAQHIILGCPLHNLHISPNWE